MLGSRLCCSWNASSANMAAWICSGAWWDGFKHRCVALVSRLFHCFLCVVMKKLLPRVYSGLGSGSEDHTAASLGSPEIHQSQTLRRVCKEYISFKNMSSHAVMWQRVNLQICMSLGFSRVQQILHVRKVAAGMCLRLQSCTGKGPLKPQNTGHRQRRPQLEQLLLYATV